MGSCCSSSNREEDDESLYRQTRSSLRPVPATVRQLPRQTRQQVHTAPSTIQIAQTSTYRSEYRSPVRSAEPLSVRNSQHVVIKPGTSVKILPKSVTQQISIIEVENCKACGQSDHTKAVCRYRERLCFYCREEGHIISICPAKKRQRQRKQTQRKRHHNTKRF